MVRKPGYDFSFSGIKTWVANHVDAYEPLNDAARADLVASFQEAVAETLVIKTLRAVRATGVRRVVVSGGVAANSRLRALMRERCASRGVEVSAPPISLCTDNAAMIGAAGYERAWRCVRDETGFTSHALDASSSESLDALSD
jgi:N6-L-threonylcarbamoyladenine synthase